VAACLATAAPAAHAQAPAGPAAPPAWPTSPFHGVIDGSGKRIPCRCRFQGTTFMLGETVCMNTYLGVQLARCDIALNNTSWVPTGVPCTISRAPQNSRIVRRMKAARESG